MDHTAKASLTNSKERRPFMEQLITTLVDWTVVPVTNFIAFAVENGVAFVLFAVIWAAFGWALVASQGSLDTAWQWSRGLPLIVQGLVWLLFLPIMAGLWIWETTWALVVRLVLIVGLAGWSLLIFLPRWLTAAKP